MTRDPRPKTNRPIPRAATKPPKRAASQAEKRPKRAASKAEPDESGILVSDEQVVSVAPLSAADAASADMSAPLDDEHELEIERSIDRLAAGERPVSVSDVLAELQQPRLHPMDDSGVSFEPRAVVRPIGPIGASGAAMDDSGIRGDGSAATDTSGVRPLSVSDDNVVPLELPRVLQIAIHETVTHATAAGTAVVAAGHVVSASGAGPAAVDRIRQVLATVDAVIVGLPGGEPVIDAALALAPRRPVVIAAITGTSVDAIRASAEAGADLATVRPHDVERLAPLLYAAGRLADERRDLSSVRGSEAVLRARLDAVADAEPGGLQPFELFQRILELEMRRARRYAYPIAIALFAVELDPPPPPPGVRRILHARVGNALIHAIRDIDLATELDHERFLVLLPYTTLTGATEVGRRIIAAVGAVDPVVAGGRTFPPRVVSAVAGAAPGEPLSFARLMRDATRALEQARRDGAELAVAVAFGQGQDGPP